MEKLKWKDRADFDRDCSARAEEPGRKIRSQEGNEMRLENLNMAGDDILYIRR